MERLRELEQLDREAKEMAISLLEAIIFQGNQRVLAKRLSAQPG